MVLRNMYVYISINLICCACFATTQSNVTTVLASLYNNEELLPKEAYLLKDANVNDLPIQLKNLVKRIYYGEHMCCRNMPVSLITKSRSVKRVSSEKSEVHVGSRHCGFIGLGSCDKFGFTYRQIIRYVTEYYKVINYDRCPDKHVVCCYLYIMVAHKCVYLDDLHSITKELVG